MPPALIFNADDFGRSREVNPIRRAFLGRDRGRRLQWIRFSITRDELFARHLPHAAGPAALARPPEVLRALRIWSGSGHLPRWAVCEDLAPSDFTNVSVP